MAKKPPVPVRASSGNVFADIGVPEPEEELAKAQLASRIREIVRGSRLTQVAAAVVMGIDQPKVSALLSGRLSNFSSERLTLLCHLRSGAFRRKLSSICNSRGVWIT